MDKIRQISIINIQLQSNIPKTPIHDSLHMLPACLIYMLEYKNKRKKLKN